MDTQLLKTKQCHCSDNCKLFHLKGLLTEGFFWIPSLGGPTTIAARQSGSGISWLIPFVVIEFYVLQMHEANTMSLLLFSFSFSII